MQGLISNIMKDCLEVFKPSLCCILMKEKAKL